MATFYNDVILLVIIKLMLSNKSLKLMGANGLLDFHLNVWKDADKDLPELQDAKARLAKLKGVATR